MLWYASYLLMGSHLFAGMLQTGDGIVTEDYFHSILSFYWKGCTRTSTDGRTGAWSSERERR